MSMGRRRGSVAVLSACGGCRCGIFQWSINFQEAEFMNKREDVHMG
ncbi:hypothetical protein Pint_21815 [Pistacia integerrima]|uniref:Uncharacterized protein n=1 Tax=Pistacia integerrima TaxID=434235 RepID=A0ACC0XBD0_9ROSI|nr:hypothetical protein Pint_21815 [Pistacia integerrima]